MRGQGKLPGWPVSLKGECMPRVDAPHTVLYLYSACQPPSTSGGTTTSGTRRLQTRVRWTVLRICWASIWPPRTATPRRYVRSACLFRGHAAAVSKLCTWQMRRSLGCVHDGLPCHCLAFASATQEPTPTTRKLRIRRLPVFTAALALHCRVQAARSAGTALRGTFAV